MATTTKTRRSAAEPSIEERRARLHDAEADAIRTGNRAQADAIRADLVELDRLEEWERQRAQVAAEDREAQARLKADEDTKAKHQRALALHAQRRDRAAQIETEIQTKVRPLIHDLVTASRAEHDLTNSRATAATAERLGEWLLVQLGLPSPWAVVPERKKLTLGQLIGVEPLLAPEPPTVRQRPVRRPVTDAVEDD